MQKYEGYKFDIRQSLIGVQFLFVAFGALVLVPILTGLDTSVALFTAGLGTLAFQLITRKNVPPIFLASSFAFIAPISYGVGKWGIPATMGGIVFAGLLYVVLSFIIRVRGDKFTQTFATCCGWACYYDHRTFAFASCCKYGYGKD